MKMKNWCKSKTKKMEEFIEIEMKLEWNKKLK